MFRATVIFVVLAGLLAGVNWVSKSVLHLDCLGPMLPVWGCLAKPYPDSVPQGFGPFFYGMIALGVWIACYIARDLVFSLAALGTSRFFRRHDDRGELETPEGRTYRIR
jgi:hypothetical protein